MSAYQIPLLNVDRLIKLSEVERELARIFNPVPNRKTIYGWLEDGTLLGIKVGRGDNYYVYESSLDAFVAALQPSNFKKAA